MIECILRKKERKIRSRTNCPKKHVRTKHETEKPKTPIGVLLEIIVELYRANLPNFLSKRTSQSRLS